MSEYSVYDITDRAQQRERERYSRIREEDRACRHLTWILALAVGLLVLTMSLGIPSAKAAPGVLTTAEAIALYDSEPPARFLKAGWVRDLWD